MAIINSANLAAAAQTSINNFSNACSSGDFLISAVVNKFESNIASFVSNSSMLPDLWTNNIPNGHIVYQDDINLPLYSHNCCWVTFDGRRYRFDDREGTIWTWGTSGCGQLGDGTTVSKSSPVSLLGGYSDWCQVAGGRYHSLGLRNNGTIWAWGDNVCGALGDNTAVTKCSPVSVVGGYTDWCHVEAGSHHNIGIRTNGTAWAWGDGTCGELGDGSITNKSSPVSVVGGFTDWRYISAGCRHTTGLRTNGTLYSWGRNNEGQLGDGTTVNKCSPVSVVGGFTDWCQLSVGDLHTLGVRTNGTLWAWGYGQCGRMGDGTTVNKSSPISAIGGFTDWCQASAGRSHSIGLRTNGTLWAWGYACHGRLGDGSTTNKSSPVSVVGGFTDWCCADTGNSHTLGIRTNGTVWAWGAGSAGRLGDGTTVNKCSPASVVGGYSDWCQVSGGGAHTVGLKLN